MLSSFPGVPEHTTNGLFALSKTAHPFLLGTKATPGKINEYLDANTFSFNNHLSTQYTDGLVSNNGQVENGVLSHHLQHDSNYPGKDFYFTQKDEYKTVPISSYDDSYIINNGNKCQGYYNHDCNRMAPVHGPEVSLPTEPQMGLIDIAKQHPTEQSPTPEVETNEEETHPLIHSVSSLLEHHGANPEGAYEYGNDNVQHVQHVTHNEVIDTPNGPVVVPRTETHIWLSPTEPTHEGSQTHVDSLVEQVGGQHETPELLTGHPLESHSEVHLEPSNHHELTQVHGEHREAAEDTLVPRLGEHFRLPNLVTGPNGDDHLLGPQTGLHMGILAHGSRSGSMESHHLPRHIEHIIAHSPNGHGIHHISPIEEQKGHLPTGFEIKYPKVSRAHPFIGDNTGDSMNYPNTEHYPLNPTLESNPMLHHVPDPNTLSHEGQHVPVISKQHVTDSTPHDVMQPVHVGINLPEIHIWPNTESDPGARGMPNGVHPNHMTVGPSDTIHDSVYSDDTGLHAHSHTDSSGASDSVIGIKTPLGKAIEQSMGSSHDALKTSIDGMQQKAKGKIALLINFLFKIHLEISPIIFEFLGIS